MGFAKAFLGMGEILSGVAARRRKENEEFLGFFREIVETVPLEVAKAFGTMGVEAFDATGKPTQGWGIVLSVADYIYWKDHLTAGARFKFPVANIKLAMMNHLSKKIEGVGLPPEERKALLAMLDEAKA